MRTSAQEQWLLLGNENGEVFLADIEEFLINRYPQSNTYMLLKMLDNESRNDIYNNRPISKKVRGKKGNAWLRPADLCKPHDNRIDLN